MLPKNVICKVKFVVFTSKWYVMFLQGELICTSPLCDSCRIGWGSLKYYKNTIIVVI